MLQPSHAYLRFRISPEVWSAMSEAERSKYKLKSFVLDSQRKTMKSTNGKLTVTYDLGAGKKVGQRKRKRCAKNRKSEQEEVSARRE